MRSLPVVFLLIAICGAYESPVKLEQTSLIRHKRDVIEDVSRDIILIVNKVVSYSSEAILHIVELLKRFLETIQNTTEDGTNEIIRKVNEILKHILATRSTVLNCIKTHRNDINHVVSELTNKYVTCVVEHLPESEVIPALLDIADKVITDVTDAFEEFKKCSKKEGMLKLHICLAKVAFRLEKKAFVLLKMVLHLLKQGKVIKFLTSIPVIAVACAPNLIAAGTGTAKIVLNVVGCIMAPPNAAIIKRNLVLLY
ncbi:uncharacterized protein LOC113231786 [Hyposmocoma kahamanoa]|uniref:uncharacterized protein LOC113231786 n=1 Tax=Hyposmocoma kahamanoa TaxID=1477025 RepID=UPI000E6D9708|nr:uncharacterized protein LOC113231786 [Hyposmocoma kahamanoa]